MAKLEDAHDREASNDKSPREMRITRGLLARNTLLNLVGKMAPLVASLICVPLIIRGLGVERYGLLSLSWAILGYSLIFDLGLGRATIKFVAEALGKNDGSHVSQIVWTALSFQLALGIIAGFVLIGVGPLLVTRLLNVPLELMPEAISAIYLLALSLPVTMLFHSISGVLHAAQRFDLVNAVEVPLSILTPILTLTGALSGFRLAGIIGLILCARLAALLASTILVLRLMPNLRKPMVSLTFLPRLFSFGGWMTVSSAVVPILQYMDRFFLASGISVNAVAYYTAPQNAVNKLWIIPSSLVLTLFPAFSTLRAAPHRQPLHLLFARAIKYTVLAIGPLAILILLYSREALHVWLGADFAMQSTVAMRIFVIGIILNALSAIPSILLQGIGRPDVTAKLHLVETPPYIAALWFSIGHWGIVGAAAAWTLRFAVDAALLFTAAFRICELPLRLSRENGLVRALAALAILTGSAWGLKALMQSFSLFMQLAGSAVLLTLFAWLGWTWVLDSLDRATLMKGVGLR